jgi:folylpolyglutamate synthase/dihydropteroate synthase
MAFLYFAECADIMVIECGIGGLLDATNVLKKPLLCVITSISYDHTHILGKTLTEITNHKTGILKPNCVVISAFQEDEVRIVIQDAAQKNHCVLHFCQEESNDALARLSVSFLSHDLVRDTNEKNVYKHAGRTHLMFFKEVGYVLLDGAHNMSSALYLRKFTTSLRCECKYVIAVCDGRDIDFLEQVVEEGKVTGVCEFEDVEGMPWIKPTSTQILHKRFGGIQYSNISEFFNVLGVSKNNFEYREVDKEEIMDKRIPLTVFCGSLYFMSSILRWIEYQM